MPYLKKEDRRKLDPYIEELSERVRDFGCGWSQDIGEVINSLVSRVRPQCYAHWQEVMGALFCAESEMMCRAAEMGYSSPEAVGGDVVAQSGRFDVQELARHMNDLGSGWGGQLNYVLHRLVALSHPASDLHWFEAMDTILAVANDLYVRRAYPYECEKRKENGDVF